MQYLIALLQVRFYCVEIQVFNVHGRCSAKKFSAAFGITDYIKEIYICNQIKLVGLRNGV